MSEIEETLNRIQTHKAVQGLTLQRFNYNRFQIKNNYDSDNDDNNNNDNNNNTAKSPLVINNFPSDVEVISLIFPGCAMSP